MHYQQIQPPDCLKGYVRYFWTLENACTDGSLKTFRTLADGCPGLLFQQSGQGSLHDSQKNYLPGFLLYGQTTRCRELSTAGSFRTVGVYFQPHALKSVFGLDASELTDSCLDLTEWLPKQGFRLVEQLFATCSIPEQIRLLSEYLVYQIRKNEASATLTLSPALGHILQSNGRASLRALQKQLQLSERTFERKFKQEIGISPKLFSRICRFQASLQQLRKDDYNKLSDIAFEHDYADQSHFIRTFQEFAGFSPYQYQRQSREVVENFPELIK